MVVGTGGAHQCNLLGKSSYIAAQLQRFGFLNIDVVNNGLVINWNVTTCRKYNLTTLGPKRGWLHKVQYEVKIYVYILCKL